MNIHNAVSKIKNVTLLYIAYIFFYLDGTKFTLPLDDVMKTVTGNEYIL